MGGPETENRGRDVLRSHLLGPSFFLGMSESDDQGKTKEGKEKTKESKEKTKESKEKTKDVLAVLILLGCVVLAFIMIRKFHIQTDGVTEDNYAYRFQNHVYPFLHKTTFFYLMFKFGVHL